MAKLISEITSSVAGSDFNTEAISKVEPASLEAHRVRLYVSRVGSTTSAARALHEGS